jgi:hypothetical protein
MQHTIFDRLSLLAATSVALIGLIVVPASGVSAAGPPGDAVADYLAHHPGGIQISEYEISYGGGTFVVALMAPRSAVGGPDCPSGWFCFYDRTYYGYPRGRLSDCGWQDLAQWGWEFRTESVHYNMGSGSVRFHYYGTELFRASTGNRTLPDVSPYRNWANLVRRVC